MMEFSTRQIFNDSHPELLKNIKFDCNVKLAYRQDPSNLHWITDDNGSSCICEHFPSEEKLANLKASYKNAFELIIIADDELTAQNINSLIYSARLLCYPDVNFTEHHLLEVSTSNQFIASGGNFSKEFKQGEISDRMILACLIASRASNKNLQYALEKYKYSLHLDWFTSHSASPMYGKKFYTDVRENTSHINSIYAFLCAYTIIEELGLDIRSSAKNPRFISGTNEWNSVVLNDIVKRLNDVKISAEDTIPWLIRGEPSPMYDEIKPQFTNKAEWYNPDNNVFDLELTIYEAIHYCSYIRNYFIAHKTNDIVKYINPYDIHNMQDLARRLILSTLGVWDIMLDKVIKID